MQSPADTWWRWFYTNAPAAWMSAVVAITTLIYVLRTRKRPRRLVVREAAKSSLVRIWTSVREKIGITFEGRSIKTLGQIDFELLNEGSEVIQRPVVTFTLPDETRILDTHTAPEELQAERQMESCKVTVKLPYVNPFHDHRQVISLSVLVDGPTSPVKVAGAGEGWSVRHKRLPSDLRSALHEMRGFAVFTAYFAAAASYKDWAWAKFDIGAHRFSWQDLFILSPILFGLAAVATWGVSALKKASKRQPTGWRV